MLGESKILSVLLLVLIKEGGGGTEFRIFLCKSRGGSSSFDLPETGQYNSVCTECL